MGPWDGLGARGYGAMGLWGACRMLDTAPERQARRAGPLGSANWSK